MGIKAIRVAIATAAATVANVRAYPTIPDSVEPPSGGVAVVVVPAGIVFDSTFGGQSHDYTFTVTLLAEKTLGRVGQDAIDDAVDAGAIKAAIETSATLRALTPVVQVTSGQDYGIQTYNGVDYWSLDLTVECS